MVRVRVRVARVATRWKRGKDGTLSRAQRTEPLASDPRTIFGRQTHLYNLHASRHNAHPIEPRPRMGLAFSLAGELSRQSCGCPSVTSPYFSLPAKLLVEGQQTSLPGLPAVSGSITPQHRRFAHSTCKPFCTSEQIDRETKPRAERFIRPKVPNMRTPAGPVMELSTLS